MNKLHASIALLALAAAGAHAATRTDLLGDKAPLSAATRTVQVTAKTRHVDVAQGEIVKFEANGKSFAFNFDGPNLKSFNLQRVAPAGMLDHPVTAYVSPSLQGSDGHGGHR